MELYEILYEIYNGNFDLLSDLINNPDVHKIILNAHKRHKCKVKILENLVKDYMREYEYHASEYVVERFLNDIKKYLGRKVRGLVNE